LNARVGLFLPEGERLEVMAASEGLSLDIKEQAVADWAFRNRHPAGRGTDTLVSTDLIYLPLQTPASVLGVMGVRMENDLDYRSTESRRLLDAFATQAAMAMERVQFSHQAEQAQILHARENLERALLNSISHDLRSPLASVTGVLSSLRAEGAHLSDLARRELLETACGEAERLNRFVGNLLDMTRIEAGAVRLNLEPVRCAGFGGMRPGRAGTSHQQQGCRVQDASRHAAGTHGLGAHDPGVGQPGGELPEVLACQ